MTITISLREALSRLEVKLNKRYTITELSEAVGLNHRTARELFFGNTEQIRTSTMVKVIEFFDSHGLPVTCDDFFHTENNSDKSTN